MRIKNIQLSSILNSRYEGTTEITVNDIYKGSCGGDGNLNKNIRERPKEVSLEFLNKILNKGLYNYNVESFKDILEIEEILLSYDKTNELSKIGGNVLLALEFALLKLISNNKPINALNKSPDKFPIHICPCIVTNFSEKKLGYQEILLIPDTTKFNEGFFGNMYIYRKLRDLLKSNERIYDGSFVTNLKNEAVLFYLEKLTNEVTKKLGIEFSFGLNLNNELIFRDGVYKVGKEAFLPKELITEINKVLNRFDICYLEDPLNKANLDLLGKIKSDYICGNKIFGNNIQNFKKYAKYFNCALIKINEIGCLGRLKKILNFCKNNDICTVLGQCGEETNETIIADLAAGFEFDFIKYGILGKERYLKLNELKRLESEFSI